MIYSDIAFNKLFETESNKAVITIHDVKSDTSSELMLQIKVLKRTVETIKASVR